MPERARRSVVAEVEDWREFTPVELDPVLRAAVDVFVEVGYHGAGVRQIAARAGLSVPGMLHHYASKQTMLTTILDMGMGELLTRCERAVDDAGDDAVRQIENLVECITLHMYHRRDLTFIGNSEMRSLEPPARRRLVAQRRKLQRLLDGAVDEAHRQGIARTIYPHEASRAIANICVALPTWIRDSGPLSAPDIAEQHVVFALAILEITPSRRRR